ncbi:MAG: nicotinate-nucleotide adenylyltransferase [Chloroflexi bacterium]|jgi:nicotinate-nucleotide adenylyltransferase|nr:nicotinate-nucleotide adenylyltransferase [Chloroflexota bacterium]
MKIGLLGGTFDPIHNGHLTIAEEARKKLELDKVVFIPARHPWLKADRDITDSQHRLAMVRLATASNPHFEVSTAELARPGPTYTIDTVEAFKTESGSLDDIYFIAGSDAITDLPRWKDPERVVALCQIVGIGRPGAPDIDIEALKPLIHGVSDCLRPVDIPPIDISSTAIRERVKAGLSIRDMVPPEVEDYVVEHGLYLD